VSKDRLGLAVTPGLFPLDEDLEAWTLHDPASAAFTEDAADGGLNASAGPSWRMVVALSASGVSAQGVYPGGQSENPASPWYANLVPLWWDGKYPPVPVPGPPAGRTVWSLRG
jgi:acyl-homoserine lactone acylase PvdQ